jgi:hypothetical protein
MYPQAHSKFDLRTGADGLGRGRYLPPQARPVDSSPERSAACSDFVGGEKFGSESGIGGLGTCIISIDNSNAALIHVTCKILNVCYNSPPAHVASWLALSLELSLTGPCDSAGLATCSRKSAHTCTVSKHCVNHHRAHAMSRHVTRPKSTLYQMIIIPNKNACYELNVSKLDK